MSNREVALEFIRAFCSGNIDGVEATLAKDFKLNGPLFEFTSKSDYITSLRTGDLECGEYEILGVADGGDSVAVFYSYKKASAAVTVAQLFLFVDQQISRTVLVFDPAN